MLRPIVRRHRVKEQLEDSFLVRNLEVSVVSWKISAFKTKIKSYLQNDQISPIHFCNSQICALAKIIGDNNSAKPIVLELEMIFGQKTINVRVINGKKNLASHKIPLYDYKMQ